MQNLDILFKGSATGGVGSGATDLLTFVIPAGSLEDGGVVWVVASLTTANADALADHDITPTFHVAATGTAGVDLAAGSPSTIVKATTYHPMVSLWMQRVGTNLVVANVVGLADAITLNASSTAPAVAPDFAADISVTLSSDIHTADANITQALLSCKAVIL